MNLPLPYDGFSRPDTAQIIKYFSPSTQLDSLVWYGMPTPNRVRRVQKLSSSVRLLVGHWPAEFRDKSSILQNIEFFVYRQACHQHLAPVIAPLLVSPNLLFPKSAWAISSSLSVRYLFLKMADFLEHFVQIDMRSFLDVWSSCLHIKCYCRDGGRHS